MPRPVKSHTFRGKRYGIRFMSKSKLQKYGKAKEDEVVYGLCSHPSKKGKRLCFDRSAKDLEALETFVHESGHAVWNDLDEEAITEGSKDIAKFLWRLGYRRVYK